MDILEARFKKRVTQWDLRIWTGINQTKISLAERGYVQLTEREKKKIAEALGMRTDEISWPERNGAPGGGNGCAEVG
jgi:cyanate lyase